MIISHDHKFIFIKSKKTAGTSIELALRPLCGPEDIIAPVREEDEPMSAGHEPRNWQLTEPESQVRRQSRKILGFPAKRQTGYSEHMTAKEVRSLIGEDIWHEYFKLSIERNPWDRQISHYYYQTRPGTRRNLTFDQFMTRKRAYVNNYEIYSIDGAIAVDFVMRFESLHEDLTEACKRIGLRAPLEIPRAKAGIRKVDDYRSHYNERTKALVADWYVAEIQHFGYDF
jgi:hypothetical protein